MNVRSYSGHSFDPVAAEIWVCDVCGYLAKDCTRHASERNLFLFQFHSAWLLGQIHAAPDEKDAVATPLPTQRRDEEKS